MKIWERYILREFLRLFVFFLLGFYFLYTIVDYSTHMQDFFQGKNLSILVFFQYYLFQFFKRADILIPLALLLSTSKVLCQLNVNRELIAFQSAGIHCKKLLRPLFIVGGICTVIILSVNEFVVPHSLNFIDKFYDMHLRHSFRGQREEPLHVMHLEDHSKLVYQYFDGAKEAFFDVIWIRNADDLWRMKYLKADFDYPKGQWVDHLVRDTEDCFEKVESYPSFSFKELKWNPDLPRKGYIPFENRSITSLYHFLREDPLLSTYEQQQILTQLLFKIIMPTLPLLILIAITPFCLSYYRQLSQVFIFGGGIFGFVAFIALMDAAVILGENDTFSPYVAIFLPFVFLFTFFGWKLVRLR